MRTTIYTRNNCNACTQTKRLFDLYKIAYVEINVEDDPSVAQALVDDGFRAMPVVIYTDEFTWSGLNPGMIQALSTYIKSGQGVLM